MPYSQEESPHSDLDTQISCIHSFAKRNVRRFEVSTLIYHIITIITAITTIMIIIIIITTIIIIC